jgi:hypothetical protein
MVLAISCTVMFFLFVTSFCYGFIVVENCRLIPCFSQKISNSIEVNSPTLSGRKHLILRSVSFSTISLNTLNLSNAYEFFFRKPTHVILV